MSLSLCTAGEIRSHLVDMLPDVDVSGKTTDQILDMVKSRVSQARNLAKLSDKITSKIERMTGASVRNLDEGMELVKSNVMQARCLDSCMVQILDRLKVMAGSNVTGVDEGMTRIEARLKAACEAEAENAYMHRILSAIQAKANALLLNPREKITDACQALDAVQAEYDHVKARALKSEALAVERENMISDAIGELRLILGTPKTEDLTLAKVMDLLKVKSSEAREYHARLCGAVHMLTSTPMDRVVNETVRVIGSRDYYVKALLSRFVNEGVNVDGKTVDEVLAMIEAEQKTLAERLGTSYVREMTLVKELAETKRLGTPPAREMTLVKELAETKTQLATAGKESADLARALHLAEDKINGQGTDLSEVKHALGQVLKVHDWVMATICKALHMGEKETVASIEDAIQRLVKLTQDQRTILTGVCGLLGLNVDESTYSDIVDKVGTLVQGRAQVREDLRLASGERVDLHGLREVLCKAVGLPEFTSMPTAVDRAVEVLSFERKAANMAERSTLARFRDDMRTVLGEKNATAKYMVDTVDEMRRDMASIKSALGHPSATTREVLTQIQAMHDGANRVRDAIGLRSDAPIDYVVQRIADTRRDMLWAQGTVSMVSAALTGSQTAERTEIMATLSGTIKGRERAQERAADLYTTLCTDLNMPTTLNLDEIRDRVQGLITLRSNMRTFLGKDMTDEQLLDQVTHLISLRSEYQDMSDTLSILRQSLGLGVDCDKTTLVDKVVSIVNKGEDRNMAMERRALIRFLNMAESSTWHEITNEVVRRISYKDGFISGINDLIKDAAKAVGMDPAQTTLTLPSLIQYVNACKDSLLGVVGHPGGETLSLNAALALLQSKSEYVASTLGLCKYASLDKVGDAVKNLLKDRDNQARMVATLNVPIEGRSKTRERLLTLLCEDPNRAGTMTTDEVVDLLKSKFACLALNLSLPENATLNEIMDRIRGMTPSALYWHDLASVLYMPKTAGVNEVLRRATDKIKALRDLLNF